MGSLIMAVASFLDARSRAGHWFVRIDDIDPPRAQPGAIQAITDALAIHGLRGDRDVQFQSDNDIRYQSAFDALKPALFYCTCTRAELRTQSIYPGTCRAQRTPVPDASIRMNVSQWTPIEINDGYLGPRRYTPGRDFGDFIIKRKDGLWAYNFATAVDDGHDVTDVLRGQDLAEVTGMQAGLVRALGLSVPRYSHLPLLRFPDGQKLSKQAHATRIDNTVADENIHFALSALGLSDPEKKASAAMLDEAVRHWRLDSVPPEFEAFPRIEC
jgi:glutamyl-Q tRNA(Asp) synthetase